MINSADVYCEVCHAPHLPPICFLKYTAKPKDFKYILVDLLSLKERQNLAYSYVDSKSSLTRDGDEGITSSGKKVKIWTDTKAFGGLGQTGFRTPRLPSSVLNVAENFDILIVVKLVDITKTSRTFEAAIIPSNVVAKIAEPSETAGSTPCWVFRNIPEEYIENWSAIR